MRMSPASGRPVTIRPVVLAARPGAEWRLRGGFPGIFGRLISSGENGVSLVPSGSGTRLMQSEIFRGVLVSFTGKSLTSAQASFREHNQALRRRVETIVAGQRPCQSSGRRPGLARPVS